MRSVDEWGEAERHSGWIRRLYDGLAILLLMWPATGGMWIMASTRTWGFAPGILLSLSGSALVLLRPLVFPDTPRGRAPFAFWLMALLTAWVVASVKWAPVFTSARWEALRWACLLAAAWSWMQVGGVKHRWKWLIGILLLVVALDGLYALIQEVNGSNRVLWAARPEQYGMRASGSYLCPNHFANMLAILIPVALALLFLPEAGFPLRLMALYFMGVSAPALYLTQSRSGWLGATAGIGATLLLLAWRKSRMWFALALVVLPLLGAAAGWTAWNALPAVRSRMGILIRDPEKASSGRLQMWRDAPAMFKHKPVEGFGAGSYVWAYPPFQRHVRHHLNYDFPHNEYIQVALEYGAVGLALTFAGLLACAWGITRGVLKARSRTGAFLLAGAGGSLVASLLHACFDFNFHIFPNPHALVWVGGVAWGVWFMKEKGAEAVSGARRWMRWIWAPLGAVACGVGAWLAVVGGVSYLWNLKAEIARNQLEWDVAGEKYGKSIRWDPRNAQPHQGLGNLKIAQSTWFRNPDVGTEKEGRHRLAREAAEHFQQALALNPCDMASVFGLARAHNLLGEPEEALNYYRQARNYAPRHVFYREQLGIQLRQMGRDAEALEVFRQNVADGVSTEISTLNIRAIERKQAREAASPPPS